MVTTIAFFILQGFCFWVLIKVVSLNQLQRIPAALALGVYVYLCFHVAAGFPVHSWAIETPVYIKAISILIQVVAGIITLWTWRHFKSESVQKGKRISTRKMVQSGPFRRVRQPGYACGMAAAIGAVIFRITPFGVLLMSICLFLYFVSAKMVDKANATDFGNEYDEYSKETKLVFPYLI